MGCCGSKQAKSNNDLLKDVEFLFFDCDDTLYQNNWATAKLLKESISRYTVEELGLDEDYAYELYLEHGTALRGLIKEKHLSEEKVEHFLEDVHNVPLDDIEPNPELREMLLSLGHKRRWVFTASIKEHAEKCLEKLGIADLFEGIIDCRSVDLVTKHDKIAFVMAMEKANAANPKKILFMDDSVKNIKTARALGLVTCLVGKTERGTGLPLVCESAHFQVNSLLELRTVMPELFENETSTKAYIEGAHPQDEEVSKRKVVFVLGGPACGKGTQSAKIIEEFGDIEHMSVGDLLRAEQKDPSSKYGQVIKTCIENGQLLSSEITMKLIVQAFENTPSTKFLIDGFPRDIENYNGWEKVVEKGGFAKAVGVLFYDAPEEVLLERLLGRAKAATEQRADDNEATAKKRFKTFQAKTLPLVKKLDQMDSFHRIDATRSVDDIYAETKAIIQNLLM